MNAVQYGRWCHSEDSRGAEALRAPRWKAALLWFSLLFLCSGRVYAAETDQYLAWGVELKDSADAINKYLNDETQKYLRKINRPGRRPDSPEQMTRDLYYHFFKGLHASRSRHWLQHSEELDRYPDSSVSSFKYQSMSIYRGRCFPYVLPMSRTIRVGEVYFGIDKFSHFFGFGRRYYEHYLHLCAEGLGEEQAMKKVVLAGVFWENSLVGKLVDGIFSHADLEADFQGFLMAKDLCAGEAPRIERKDGAWVLVRPIDIRPYVTPDFDESYNPSHYRSLRKRFVLALLKEEYRSKAVAPAVQDRFARYRLREPSFSKRAIQAYFDRNGRNPQKEQYFDALGSYPGGVADGVILKTSLEGTVGVIPKISSEGAVGEWDVCERGVPGVP